MDVVRELGAEIDLLAETNPLDPIDSMALLSLGRRGKRRRRILGAGAAIAGTAAAVVAGSLLPNIGTGIG